MNKEILLSIYIATYNRADIIKNKIEELLKVESDDFDIWVLDDCSDDKTYDNLKTICDERLHVIRNESRQGCKKDGAMPNWYKLLECCDGRFCFHLNDRDILQTEELNDFIEFLRQHKDYTGGICDSYSGVKIYNNPDEALLAVPYRAVHPTGTVFRTELYRSIIERESYFTKDKSYIHPHDLILGKLSRFGKMFEYKKIYTLADTASFSDNKSFLYKKGSEKTSWFSPGERTKEFKMFINHLSDLDCKTELKKKKAYNIAKAYLYFCTFNYKYYVTDYGQTQHYGIEPQKISWKDLVFEMKSFVEESSNYLKNKELIENPISYCRKLKLYFWMVFWGKPLWDLYKKGINRKW